jgi:hypothetical protein
VPALPGEGRQYDVVQALGVLPLHIPDDAADRLELLFRCQAVGSTLTVAGCLLFLESRHPDLKEFVQVRAEDSQELEPLQ